ncbi:MAG: hypothetical protein Ct9H300mP14_02510 [Gammaproteobacteria bacterium]|nr:MAG: hypothetical protein Ct9H300mP14_02510 [Gammaproteobacteria bacterium]
MHAPITHLIEIDEFKCLPGLLNVLGGIPPEGGSTKDDALSAPYQAQMQERGSHFPETYAQSLRPRTAIRLMTS